VRMSKEGWWGGRKATLSSSHLDKAGDGAAEEEGPEADEGEDDGAGRRVCLCVHYDVAVAHHAQRRHAEVERVSRGDLQRPWPMTRLLLLLRLRLRCCAAR